MSLAPLAPLAVSASMRAKSRVAVAFGRRFVLFWALGLAWAVPAFWNVTFLYAIAVWDAVLVAAWALDLWRLPRPAQIVVQRRWASPLCLAGPARVELHIRNEGAAAIVGTLIDEVPAELRTGPPVVHISVDTGETAAAPYDVMPRDRGDIEVKKLYLRYGTRLRLAERWAVADVDQTVRVYPNFERAKGNTIYLTRSRRIELEKRLLRRRGQGREF